MKRCHGRLRQDRPSVDQRPGRNDVPSAGRRFCRDRDPDYAVMLGVPNGCTAEPWLNQVTITTYDLHPAITLPTLNMSFRPDARVVFGRKAECAKRMLPQIARREQPFRCDARRQWLEQLESSDVSAAIRLWWLPNHHPRRDWRHALCRQRKVEPDRIDGRLCQVTAQVERRRHHMRACHHITRRDKQPCADNGFVAIDASDCGVHALSHVYLSISAE